MFERGIFWPQAASVSNPLAVTRAYVELFKSLGGVSLTGDARSLHRSDGRWRVDTSEGPVDAPTAVVALGPWAPDVLEPLNIRLPLEVKRGYHLHFSAEGNKGLNRPVLDAEVGYAVVPMEQGLRLTTGAEFASRDAKPTPVQFDRVLPKARALFPLGKPLEAEPWMGRRPCFPDSKPVIGPAPGQSGLWLDYGHAHWGLTLGPVSGRLIAEMITGEVPFTDPAPYSAGAVCVLSVAVSRSDVLRRDLMPRRRLRRRQFAKLEAAADGDVEEGALRRRSPERVIHGLRHLAIGERAARFERDLQFAPIGKIDRVADPREDRIAARAKSRAELGAHSPT